jgi:TolB-like protein
MSDQSTNSSFLKRLIEARVIQTLAIYIPVGWILTEIATQATDTFSLPYWIPGSAMALFIAGIPVAAFLAWAFQITHEGIRLEVASLKGGLAVTIAISLMLGISAILFQRIENVPDPEIDQAGIANYGSVHTAVVNSIAVMPFDSKNSSLGQIFSGEISERLAKHADLYVIAPSSTHAVSLASIGPVPVQKSLQAQHLLTGSIQSEGDAFKLALSLSGENQQTVWREDFLFGGDAESQKGLQRRIAKELAGLLGTRTPSAEYCDPTSNLTALENYHEARLLNNKKGPENLARAEALLREAIELDPTYGRAYAALAVTKLLQRKSPPGLIGDLSRKALNHCPNIGVAYKIWVPSYEGIANEWVDQELQWRDALALEPNDLWMLDNYVGMHLSRLGMLEEVLVIDERSYRNNPLDPRAVVGWAWDRLFMKEYDRARELAHQALELGDNSCNAHMLLYVSEIKEGRDPGLMEAAFINIPQRCKDAMMQGMEGLDSNIMFYAKRDPIKRRELMEHLRQNIEKHPNHAFTAGLEIGAPNLVFDAVEIAMRENRRLHLPAMWEQDENATLIRRDPRFIEFVKELGMDEYWREFGWPSNGMCTPFGDSFVCDN